MEELKTYGFIPTYVIATVDGTFERAIRNELKKSTEIERNYYVTTICLPQGINLGSNQKDDDTFLHCTNDDYAELFAYIISIVENTTTTKFRAISISFPDLSNILSYAQYKSIFFRLQPLFYLFLLIFVEYDCISNKYVVLLAWNYKSIYNRCFSNSRIS